MPIKNTHAMAASHADIMTTIKPSPVVYAELALWVWTAWTCGFGVYQSSADVADIQKQLADKLGGAVVIDPHLIVNVIIGCYAILVAASAWIIVKIGAGKHWARSSLLFGFGLQAILDVMPPWHGPLYYLKDIPDWGLQIYAIVLLYTWPGRLWFHADIKERQSRTG